MENIWIEKIDEFLDIAPDWDEAVAASGEDNPFLLSDFIKTWWKYYSKNKKLLIFAVYDRGEIIAGIPLYLKRKTFQKIITHIGDLNANVTHFFSINKKLNFVDSLMSSLEKRDDWDILVLDRVLSTHPTMRNLKETKSLFSGLYIYYLFDAGFNGIIDLTKGYGVILENLSTRLRRYLRKSKKEINENGELKLQRVSGASNVRSLFKTYRDLSIKAFRKRKNFSAFEDKNRSNFYEELLILFDQKNRLDAHKLTAKDATLGISFGYRFGKGFKWILTAFNPHYSQLRPGHLLIDALIQEAIHKGDPFFDMYYGGEVFYKQQWCTKLVSLKRLEICRKTFINRSIGLTRNALRSNTLFMNSARRAKRFFHKIFT